jgi:hypothetical protein
MLEKLKMFFDKSFYFWQITKILFIIIFSCAIYGETKSRPLVVIITISLFFGLFIFSMIYSLLLTNQNPKVLKLAHFYSSIFSILFGFVLSYSMLTLLSGRWYENVGFQIVPLWIILFGIREFLINNDH